MVTEEVDRRKEKKSDVSIIRIKNARTYVLVQCKTEVGLNINPTTVDPVSQLFLEAWYVRQKEDGKVPYDKMLCILTNWEIWHCFILDVASMPVVVQDYIRVSLDTTTSTTASSSDTSLGSHTDDVIQKIVNIACHYTLSGALDHHTP